MVKGLIDGELKTRTILFSETKRKADKISQLLCKAGIAADAIHGDKSQRAREIALRKFKRGQVHVLVATDVVARGDRRERCGTSDQLRSTKKLYRLCSPNRQNRPCRKNRSCCHINRLIHLKSIYGKIPEQFYQKPKSTKKEKEASGKAPRRKLIRRSRKPAASWMI